MADVLNFNDARARKLLREAADEAGVNPKVRVQVGRGRVLVYRNGERVLELTLGAAKAMTVALLGAINDLDEGGDVG